MFYFTALVWLIKCTTGPDHPRSKFSGHCSSMVHRDFFFLFFSLEKGSVVKFFVDSLFCFVESAFTDHLWGNSMLVARYQILSLWSPSRQLILTSDPWHQWGNSLYTAVVERMICFWFFIFALFLRPSSVIPRDVCDVAKIPTAAVTSDLQPIWHKQPCSPHPKSLKCPRYLFPMLTLNISNSLFINFPEMLSCDRLVCYLHAADLCT